MEATELSRVTRPSRKLLLPRPPEGLSKGPGEVFSSTGALKPVRPSCSIPDLCSVARRAQEEARSPIRQELLECSDPSLQELFKDRLLSDPAFQTLTVGLPRGNGLPSSQRIQSTEVRQLAVARSLRAQRFHTLRRKDPPRLLQPAVLRSFPTARSPRPHPPPGIKKPPWRSHRGKVAD